MRAKLTKTTVDAAQPGAANIFLWDTEMRGFGLKVTPAGNKVFLIQYRMGGRAAKTRRYTIGTYGSPWTHKKARDEAERLLTLVRQGVDPGDYKVDRQRAAATLAFDDYAVKFLGEYVKANWKSSYADAERIVRKHLVPVLGRKALPSIRKADITAVFDRIKPDKTGPKVALKRKVHAVMSRLFRWAVGRGDIDRSPLEGAEPPPKPESRTRWLQDWELRFAWLAADTLGYPFGPMYRLLILSAARREEVAALDWKELHRASAEWHLHEDRSKNDEPTVIALTAPMLVVLDGIAKGEKWPKRGLVFTTTDDTHVSGYSRGKSRLDKAMLKLARKEAEDAGEEVDQIEFERWTVHDLRRTLATGMQRLGIRFEVVEAILNHVSGSKSGVAGVYQRHSWSAEKRDALNAWSAHVERVAAGAGDETNVVQLAVRA